MIEVAFALDPVWIVNRVHAVRSFKGSIGEAVGLMADRAFPDGAGMSLQLDRGDIVIGVWIAIGPDGVGAAMTAFTSDSRMVVQAVPV